jgi:hypothetical protein
MQCIRTRYGPAISSYLREFSPDFSFRLFVAGQAFADISDMFPHPFSQPIGTLPIGNWVSGIAEPGSRPLQVLRRDEPLSRALALLLEGSLSA